MKRSNPFREVITRELAKHPDVAFRFEPRGKHESVVIMFGGRQRFTPFPASGSDHRGPKNKACEVRRIIRDLKGQA